MVNELTEEDIKDLVSTPQIFTAIHIGPGCNHDRRALLDNSNCFRNEEYCWRRIFPYSASTLIDRTSCSAEGSTLHRLLERFVGLGMDCPKIDRIDREPERANQLVAHATIVFSITDGLETTNPFRIQSYQSSSASSIWNLERSWTQRINLPSSQSCLPACLADDSWWISVEEDVTITATRPSAKQGVCNQLLRIVRVLLMQATQFDGNYAPPRF